MFQFPVNPVLDQKFSPLGGPAYKWNGTGWIPFTLVYRGGLTFTGPVLFADGTLQEPGIAWANEPSMGIWRAGVSHMQAVIGGAAIWGMNASTFALGTNVTFNATIANFGGVVNANASIRLPIGQSVYSPTGELLHAGGDNRIWLGRYGYAETILASSGTNRVHVHGGGVALTGNVTGVTAGMVGLGNVVNSQQVINYAPWNGALYMAWDGAHILGQYGGTNFGSWWPIDVTGSARSMWTPEGVISRFNWVTQGGSPSWAWAGPGDGNFYLYNPANFSVNYAAGSGYANDSAKVGGIGPWNWSNRGHNPVHLWANDGNPADQFLVAPGNITAGYSSNSGQVNGIGGWTYSNEDNNPVYIWSTNGDGQHQFLASRASLSVNYANSANTANSATNANYANNAGYANSANYANSAGSIGGGGRVIIDANTFFDYYPANAWDKMAFLSQSSSSYLPGYGIHRQGYIAWVMLIDYANRLAFGTNHNGGAEELLNWSMVIGEGGFVEAKGFGSPPPTLRSAEPLTGALVNVLELRGVRGYDEHMKRETITVEADGIKRVFPELAHDTFSETGNVIGATIDYISLIAPIIEALRSINERLNQLEAKP